MAWTAAETLHRMPPNGARGVAGRLRQVALGEFAVNPGWIGMSYVNLARAVDITIAVVNRFGDGVRPHPDLMVQEDDRSTRCTT